MDTTEEILDLEARRVAATNCADATGLSEILHTAYVHVTGTGDVLDRNRYIQWVGEIRREHRRDNLKVIQQGDTALIVGDLENRIAMPDGTTKSVKATVLESVVRQDGRWRILSFQITGKGGYL